MSLTCVGSVAFDTVETPFGARDRMLGGSATHFSLAASYFTGVRVVGVVGDDFGDAELRVFAERAIDVTDIERIAGGHTFFWRGQYDYDLNTAHTLDTQLNVFANFEPKLCAEAKRASTVFLGNIQPGLQSAVRAQCTEAGLVALDSMNYWIDTARDALRAAIGEVHCVLLNDAEARMLAGEPALPAAARIIRSWGPEYVVVKLGEYGAALFTSEGFFAVPGYPLERVIDPTGAGDSFAGGFLGYLDAHTGEPLSDDLVRRAMVYGSVLGSFNVEAFGTERVAGLSHAEIAERFDEFKRMTHFEAIPFRREAVPA
jgi:sugar/nucleoside kinase (ribokinase family)